jgi:putative flippase GtrA
VSNVTYQAARFGAVGLLATVVHVTVAIGLVELTGLPVFWANIAAFSVAVVISYAGNHRWTFARDGAHARYFPRFVAIAALGLALSQGIVWGITEGGGDYRIAVLTVALVVPIFGFLASRFLVFIEREDDAGGFPG